MSKLIGKNAIVTGGSRGIGAATALRLAKDGANVAITYAKSPEAAEKVVAEIRALGRKAIALKADGNDPASIRPAIAQVLKELGGLDIFVANAGIFEMGPIDDFTGDAWVRTMNVNVTAVAIGIEEAAKAMPKGGRIVTVGSVLGERVPMMGLASYSASKFAIVGVTRAAARDLGPRGITANVVQPGPINTDMNPETGDFAAAQAAGTALGRYGQPEELAAAIAFLVGPDASYITGSVLTVDGGYNA